MAKLTPEAQSLLEKFLDQKITFPTFSAAYNICKEYAVGLGGKETSNGCVEYNGTTISYNMLMDFYKSEGPFNTKISKGEEKAIGPAKPLSGIQEFLSTCYSKKPKDFFMDEIKWKYLARSIYQGKNILLVGPTGCGKTKACKAASELFPERPFFVFNLGNTQDPKSALIGNTHFKKDEGTFFAKSLFVTAIQTPFAKILLDELTRAHPDAHNILMPVLDDHQRYLRIDDAADTPTIKVAEGVTFMATANIGNEYTATRVMDRAMRDRFSVVIEMNPLDKNDEEALLTMLYPDVDNKLIKAASEVAEFTRTDVKKAESKLSTIISTRANIELIGMLRDGFTFQEASDVVIVPLYSDDGGGESERTHIKQVLQKYCVKGTKKDMFNTDAESVVDENKRPF